MTVVYASISPLTTTMAAPIMDTIMLLGDSITQGGWQAGGFAQRLAYVYARKLDVLNRGLSGYNSDWAIPVFKQVRPPLVSLPCLIGYPTDSREEGRAISCPQDRPFHHLVRRKRRVHFALKATCPPFQIYRQPRLLYQGSQVARFRVLYAPYPRPLVHPASHQHLPAWGRLGRQGSAATTGSGI